MPVPIAPKLLILAVAGACGTLARYGMAGVAQRLGGDWFPWGTFAVNVFGCLLFGLVYALAEDRVLISGQTRFFVLVGFMGAFTTFSTFIFESGDLLRDGQMWRAFANLGGQAALGLTALFVGLVLGRLV